jgi:hypothetical protein
LKCAFWLSAHEYSEVLESTQKRAKGESGVERATKVGTGSSLVCLESYEAHSDLSKKPVID